MAVKKATKSSKKTTNKTATKKVVSKKAPVKKKVVKKVQAKRSTSKTIKKAKKKLCFVAHFVSFDNTFAYYCLCNFTVPYLHRLTVYMLERNLLELIAFAK